ncbi:AI-2E family transporter [Caenispirillum salinarum]|uniref:AI-2E family transporter n=1 Tax=Caenispirillum salinarum TaxID=859058 RepID=UPI00384C568B
MVDKAEQQGIVAFARRVLVVLGIAVVGGVLWMISRLLVMVFGGLLLAVILRRISKPVGRWLHLDTRIALGLVVVVILAVLVGVGWLFGHGIVGQYRDFLDALSGGYQRLVEWGEDVGLTFPEDGSGMISGVVTQVLTAATVALDVFVALLIIIFVGIYAAASPRLYKEGVLLLVPSHRRERAGQVLDATGEALWRWLVGQLVAMVAVGVMTTVTLWLLGVPMAITLGIIAALLEFVPIIGPIMAAVPAILVALTVDVWAALWVVLAYTVIQQVESYLVTPLAERWAVALPPALLVFSTMAFALLFGFPGLIFAAPMTLAVMVFVRMIYVRDILGNRPKPGTRMPG